MDGNFQSTLRLTDRAREAARLRNGEYKGEVCPTKPEAEHSAARGFWDDPLVKEIAAKLEPSKKTRKNRKMCAEANAKRKALYGYGPGGKRITREDRKGVEKALSGHHVPCVAGAGSGFARRCGGVNIIIFNHIISSLLLVEAPCLSKPCLIFDATSGFDHAPREITQKRQKKGWVGPEFLGDNFHGG